MFFSIRHKLTLAFTLLFVMVFAALGLYLSSYYAVQYQGNLETELINDARLLAEFVSTLEPDLISYAEQVSRELDLRVTIIDMQGNPLAETWRSVDELENHIDRPEVQAALERRTEISRRYSATLGTDMIYAASPVIGSDGEVVAVFRLARSLEQVQAVVAAIRWVTFVAMLIGLIATWLFGYLLAGAFTKSLAALSRKARDFGRGIFTNQDEVWAKDEIGLLEQAFNEMGRNVVQVMANLSRERRRVEQILRHLPVGVLVIGGGGRMVAANTAAQDMLGTATAEGDLLLDQVTRNHQVNQFVNSLLEDRVARQEEVSLVDEEGRRLYIRLRGAAVEKGAGEVVVVLQDVTDLRLLEQQRKDLVANVSHELRTPLTAIQGYAETLLDGDLDENTTRQFIEIIRRESLRLSRLLNDLLNLSRLEGGKTRKQGVSNVAEVARGVMNVLADLAADKETEVSLDVAPDVQVAVDRDYLEQILMNYIDNAIKYTPPGTRVQVGADRLDDGYVRIAVSDNGPGIPVEDQTRVFQRFFRVEKSRHRKAGGTGLGLAIVKHVVEGFGGQVGVISNPRSGTSFWATLHGATRKE